MQQPSSDVQLPVRLLHAGFNATVLIERLQRAPVLRAEVEATVAAALDSHICRCTGYVRYYQAVRDVILATPGLTRDGA